MSCITQRGGKKSACFLFSLLNPVLKVDCDVTIGLLVHETLHEIYKFHEWNLQVFINCGAVFIQIEGSKKHAFTQVLWLLLLTT